MTAPNEPVHLIAQILATGLPNNVDTLYAGSSYSVVTSLGTWTTHANGFIVPQAGLYLLVGGVEDNVGTARVGLTVNNAHNGSGYKPWAYPGASATASAIASTIIECATGDQLGVIGFQQSGAPQTVNVFLQASRLNG